MNSSNNKKINVLVTGVGAIIGYGVIKSIRNSKIDANIIGMDIYSDAVGQHWCDKFIQAKYAVDEDYIEFLKKVICENSIDIVFFGTEQEIYRVTSSKEELGMYYSKLVVNNTNILELAEDKWSTYTYLMENGLENIAIPSKICGNYEELSHLFSNRFMLKPRKSYASKGINIVENQEEFDFYKKKMKDNFMAQKLIGDIEHEYTVAVFGLGDGRIAASIYLKRKLSQEGATAKAVSFKDIKLEEIVDHICRRLKPIGPTNLQFRLHNGQYFLLEINPRISSSTSIRSALGYNEAEMSIRYFVFGEVPEANVRNGKATRFIDEIVEEI